MKRFKLLALFTLILPYSLMSNTETITEMVTEPTDLTSLIETSKDNPYEETSLTKDLALLFEMSKDSIKSINAADMKIKLDNLIKDIKNSKFFTEKDNSQVPNILRRYTSVNNEQWKTTKPVLEISLVVSKIIVMILIGQYIFMPAIGSLTASLGQVIFGNTLQNGLLYAAGNLGKNLGYAGLNFSKVVLISGAMSFLQKKLNDISPESANYEV